MNSAQRAEAELWCRRWSALRGASVKVLRRRYPASDLRHFALLLCGADMLADPALRIEFRLLRSACQEAAGDTPDYTRETVPLD